MAEGSSDVRPLVASSPTNRGVWVFGGGLALGALLLFQALEARRASLTAPAISAPPDSTADQGRPPRLAIPPEPVFPTPGTPPPPSTESTLSSPVQLVPQIRPQPRTSPYSPGPFNASQSGYGPSFPDYAGSEVKPNAVSLPAGPSTTTTYPDPAARQTVAAGEGKDRVKAARFLNPSTTVPKGTVIQAVLESALDSTRGGFVRALVSRDINGFDGNKVLIQRGSRILGEYKSDVSLGQKRVLIQWQRLTRPDGVIIDLDSPSADPLGRAGTGGKVDTHFFERFAGAFLQSTLNIGVQLAARAASRDTIVLALPGSVQQGLGTGQGLQPERIAPTVTVKQGSSVSVFVAKDLDFTDTDK